MNKKIWLGSLFIVILVLGIFLDLVPLWKRYWKIHLQFETVEKKHTLFKNYSTQANAIQHTFVETKNAYAVMTKMMPQAENFNIFLNTITGLAIGEGLKVNSLLLGTIKENESCQEIPLHVQVVGGYTQFLNFLKRLQLQQYVMHVESFALTRELPPVTTVLKPDNTPDMLDIDAVLVFPIASE